MGDLSNPSDAPGLSLEAVLRALKVLRPADGLSYDRDARLVVVGADVSSAQAEPNYPECTYGSTTLGTSGPDGALTWSGFEMIAGDRGIWLTFWASMAVGNVTIFQLDQRPSWFNVGIGVSPDTRAGGYTDDLARFNKGFLDNTGPGGGQPGLRIGNTVAGISPVLSTVRVWVPPGRHFYAIGTDQNQAMTMEGIGIRAPLAAP